jgi:excisionase family DNA binding protein
MDDMRNTSAPLYGKAEPATTKTTMSVREMRQLLGLGKTDSYWLLHKNLFEVILINDKRRIVISSFEKWYANQVKYHKVNGSPPGEELCKRSYSVPDAAEILKVKPETIYTLIRQGKLKTETTDFWMRIPKEEFERWYRSQSRYRTAADREIEAQTISIPEMAKLLGIPRKNVYGILDCKKYRDCFVIERVADRPRITKTSFEIWLNSQSTYRLQEPIMEAHEEPPLELKCPKSGKYYSFQEIQDFYGVSRTTLVTWIREERIPTIDVGRAKRVRKDVFDDVLKSKRKVEGDT